MLTVVIDSPLHRKSLDEADAPYVFEGTVAGFSDSSAVTIRWFSDRLGVLFEGHPSPVGLASTVVPSLERGFHEITLEAIHEDGRQAAHTIEIGVCGWELIADFNQTVPGWRSFGDATLDPRGWLELTGNARDRKGAFFDVSHRIAAGNIRLRFRISTGQCNTPGPCNIAGGADGFALSVFDLRSESDLELVLDAAGSGGALGYGIGGCWGNNSVNGFHVEIDTWFNQYNGSSELHTDPTDEDHVEVTFDGNPGGSVCSQPSDNPFAPIADIEDNEWHVLEAGIIDDQVDLVVDGVRVIQQSVPGLDFKGGFIGFTGTTGFFTNYHRIDELEVQRDCNFAP